MKKIFLILGGIVKKEECHPEPRAKRAGVRISFSRNAGAFCRLMLQPALHLSLRSLHLLTAFGVQDDNAGSSLRGDFNRRGNLPDVITRRTNVRRGNLIEQVTRFLRLPQSLRSFAMTTQTFALTLIISLFTITEAWADTSIPAFNSAGQVIGSQPCSNAISNCFDCSYDSDKNRAVCTQCLSVYVLSEDGSKCVYPTIVNNTCAGNASYVKVNEKCVIMNECRSRNSNSICTACYNGYHLDENNVCVADENQVIFGNSMGCTDYYGGVFKCKACAEGYAFAGGNCYLKSDLPDCSTISDNTMCISNGKVGCSQGYYFIPQSTGSVCASCGNSTPTCHYDPQIGQKIADSCKSGYYIDETTGLCLDEYTCTVSINKYFNTVENKCKYKPDGCKNVNPDGSCVADEPCWEGYVKNSAGRCYKPLESCEDGKFAKEDQCVSECGSGYLVKSGTTCVLPDDCTGEYIVDSANNECIKMPGCIGYANGACGSCERGYLKKGNGCVSAIDGCGNGYLEKDGSCIPASQGCGSGYKNMGGYCNRVRWTPDEAAEVLNDDDNNTVTLIFKM